MYYKTMDAEAIPHICKQPTDAIHSWAGHVDDVVWLAGVCRCVTNATERSNQANYALFCGDTEYRCARYGVFTSFQSEEKIVSEKKAYPLRINAEVLEAIQRWSEDELRSLNAQIEYVLREALRKSGRLKANENQDPVE